MGNTIATSRMADFTKALVIVVVKCIHFRVALADTFELDRTRNLILDFKHLQDGNIRSRD